MTSLFCNQGLSENKRPVGPARLRHIMHATERWGSLQRNPRKSSSLLLKTRLTISLFISQEWGTILQNSTEHPLRVETCVKPVCVSAAPTKQHHGIVSHMTFVLFTTCRPTHTLNIQSQICLGNQQYMIVIREHEHCEITPGRTRIMWCRLFEPHSEYSWICWTPGQWGDLNLSTSTGPNGEKQGQITPPSVSNIELQLIFLPSPQRNSAEHHFLSLCIRHAHRSCTRWNGWGGVNEKADYSSSTLSQLVWGSEALTFSKRHTTQLLVVQVQTYGARIRTNVL